MDLKTYEKLQVLRRYKEPIQAVLRTVKRHDKDDPDTEYAEFALENGKIIGICKKEDFSDYSFRSITQFTGNIFNVVITQMSDELDINKVQVSVKEASRRSADALIRELIELEQDERMQEPTYEAEVTGYNMNAQVPTIFLRINGAECFMKLHELNYGRVYKNAVDRYASFGERIPVKVLQFNPEQRLIHVSRKAAVENPYQLLSELAEGDTIVGRVVNVDSRFGVFVELDQGCTIKGIVPKTIEQPVLDDVVSMRIVSVDVEKERGSGVIFKFPFGRKKVNDPTAFLYN
ncbi:RNA-binding protein [Bacillus toyonensis]|uniref:RNA-binding protein n=1 Tax=Bacillus toyonensis TaxID=155322 RepID=UPI000BF8E0C1|nr:RNA-binding protein [Bacillus toyonensis]PEO77400.1 RNA-binding protein [Bacillus toyonensis]PGC48644.1 RNA-binding protein [Bacillus toyonensis]PHG28894.1 RNA-binding protein [Bacillus toyonensis]